jgi:hypothetical protein
MATGTRAILSLVAVILLAGGIVMQFFVILSGLRTSPENKVYFLQSTTDNFNGNFNGGDVPNPVRWTWLAICGTDGSNNANCGPTGAAIPFDPRRNFGDDALIGGNSYYYLSRVSWAFYVIALFFAVVAFFVSVAAIVARLGAYLTGFFAFMAMASQAVAAALMTAWTVRGRNALNKSGETASLGKYAYGFTWASFACFFIAMVLFCVGGGVGKDKNTTSKSYFGRKRSTRSRGSFVENGSERRTVKDEYE